MFKKIVHLFALSLLISACFSVSAQTICKPPLPPSCVVPHWGQIEPDSMATDSEALPKQSKNDKTGSALVARVIDGSNVHIRLAQMRSSSSQATSTRPRLLVDNARQFDRETQVLVRAIERATFDKEGNLKTGEDQIERAIQALKEASKVHQLNLYIKVPRKLNDLESKMLTSKVLAVNKVIKEASSADYSSKKTPTS